MGRFTRPNTFCKTSLFGCAPSVVDVGLVVVLVVFNALVFLVYFEGWLGAGWSIDCPDAGFDCDDAPIGRAASYLTRLNMGLVWFPVCRNIWALCCRTGGRGLLSYEQQVALHRWLGYSVVASVTVHLAGFWIQWYGQGMETFLERALPTGDTGGTPRAPVCEIGMCFGICGGGLMNGLGPCGIATKKDCCHVGFQDGISEARLPSTGESACLCPLEMCVGCGGLPQRTQHEDEDSYVAGNTKGSDGERYDVGLYNFYGEVSWLAMVVMLLFGIRCCRRKHWDWFYWVHHLFVIAVIFGVLHDTNLMKVMAPGISVYVIDRIIRSRRTMHRAKLLRADLLPAIDGGGDGDNLTERAVLHLRFATGSLGGAQGLRPGQHVQILCVGISELPIWPPNGAAGQLIQEEASFDVFIKDMGPGSWSARWCRKIDEAPDLAAAIESLGPISIEGPYGGYLPDVLGEGPDHPPASVLVAGGIGITPLASMLQSLAAAAAKSGERSGDVHLWWACRYHERMVSLAKALPALTDAAKSFGSQLHVRLFITTRNVKSVRHDEHAAESETSQLQGSTVACEAQAATGNLPEELSAAMAVPASMECHRPDFAQLFEELRQNMAEATAAAGSEDVTVASADRILAVPVHVCGPVRMTVRSMNYHVADPCGLLQPPRSVCLSIYRGKCLFSMLCNDFMHISLTVSTNSYSAWFAGVCAGCCGAGCKREKRRCASAVRRAYGTF